MVQQNTSVQLGDSTASPDEGGLECMSNELFEPLGDPPPELAALAYAASTLWGQGVRDKIVALELKRGEGGHLDGAAALDFQDYALEATKQLEDQLRATQERADAAKEAQAEAHVEEERLRSENHSLQRKNHSLQRENHSLQSENQTVCKAASEASSEVASADPTLCEALTQQSADSAVDYSCCSKTPSSSTTSLLRLNASTCSDAVESTRPQGVSALQNELVKNGLPNLLNVPQKCADFSGEEKLTERGSCLLYTSPSPRD